MTYILDNTHAHARHMYVPFVENVTCVTYILDMVASRELQCFIGGSAM